MQDSYDMTQVGWNGRFSWATWAVSLRSRKGTDYPLGSALAALLLHCSSCAKINLLQVTDTLHWFHTQIFFGSLLSAFVDINEDHSKQNGTNRDFIFFLASFVCLPVSIIDRHKKIYINQHISPIYFSSYADAVESAEERVTTLWRYRTFWN